MNCIHCGCDKSKIVDSRHIDTYKRRRRVCKNCGKRYTTYEVHSDYYKLMKKCLNIYYKHYGKME